MRFARIGMHAALFASFLAACVDDSTIGVESGLTGGVSIAAPDLMCHGTSSVTVSITGTTTTTVTPTDLMLIVDESGSIGAANFARQKAFLVSLVQDLDELFANGGKVGVVFFAGAGLDANGTARTIIALSADQAAVVSAIESATYGMGGTCTGCGVARATELFLAGSDPSHDRFAIVLTDGVATSWMNPYTPPAGTPNTTTAIAAAYLEEKLADGAEQGIEYVAIGVGNAIDSAQLERIATGDGGENVYSVTDFSALSQIELSLADAISGPESTAAILTLGIHPDFTASAVAANLGSASLSGNTLAWSIPAIENQTATLTYAVTHVGDHDGAVPLLVGYAFVDAEGNALVLPEAWVQVSGCDTDGDGVPDAGDLCPGTTAGEVVDATGCSIDQLCPCDESVRDHGRHQACVAHAANAFFAEGLLDEAMRRDVIRASAHSRCGSSSHGSCRH